MKFFDILKAISDAVMKDKREVIVNSYNFTEAQVEFLQCCGCRVDLGISRAKISWEPESYKDLMRPINPNPFLSIAKIVSKTTKKKKRDNILVRGILALAKELKNK